MLFFTWNQVDWIKWMPVEVGVLVFLIVLLRIIRKLHRWGPIDVSNVTKKNLEYVDQNNITHSILSYSLNYNLKKNYVEKDYVKKPPEINKEKSYTSKNKRLLLIPPLGARIKKGYSLAISLAIHGRGWDVLILNPKQIKKFYINNPVNENNQYMLDDFLSTMEISHLFVFDYSISPILSHLSKQPIKNSNLNLTWIFIRPILSWKDVKPLWKLVPFSFQWFSKLKLLSYKFNSTGKLNLKNSELEKINLGISSKIIFIEPSKTLLSNKGKENLKKWQKNYLKVSKDNVFCLKKGKWTFFRNETVVLGIISRFLYE